MREACDPPIDECIEGGCGHAGRGLEQVEVELTGVGPGTREKSDTVADTGSSTNSRCVSVGRVAEQRRGERGGAVNFVGKGGDGGVGVVESAQRHELEVEYDM